MSTIFWVSTNRALELWDGFKDSLNTPTGWTSSYFVWFAIVIGFIVVVGGLYSWWRKKQRLLKFQSWTSIENPTRRADILKMAHARNASCSVEIIAPEYERIYNGYIFDIKVGQELILEMTHLPKGRPEDLEGLLVQVHIYFRPSPKAQMDRYQFSSNIKNLFYQKEKSWRVGRLLLAWPRRLVSAQRRDFLRLEPGGNHAITALWHDWRGPGRGGRPSSLRPVIAKGSVIDISGGGLQLIFPMALELEEQTKALITIELPMTDLDISLKETKMHLVLSILHWDLISNNETLASDGGEEASSLVVGAEPGEVKTIIRAGFVGRLRPGTTPDAPAEELALNPDAFQDITHWVNAYQRFLLKKESGMAAAPPVRTNRYPSQPPDKGAGS